MRETLDIQMPEAGQQEISILVIEDDPVSNKLLRGMVAQLYPRAGRLGTAMSLSAACEELSRQRYTVALLDLNLPDSKGLETLERLRGQFPRLAILVITGAYEDELGIKTIVLGADDYLVKGRFDSFVLHKSIQYTIERKKTEEALRQAHAALEERVRERTEELLKSNQLLQAEIAERKRVESELKGSEARLATVLATVREGITFSDEKGHFYVYNPEMERLTGYSMAEANSCSDFTLLLYPDEKQRARAVRGIAELYEKGTSREEETMIMTKSRQLRYILVSSSLVVSQGQKMFLSVYRDITEARRAREEIKMNEARYRAIVEDQTELICRALPDGTITFVNQAFCRYFNKKTHDLVGLKFTPAVLPSDQSVYKEHLSSLSWERPLAVYEFRVMLESGETRWQQWTDRGIFDAARRLIEIQSVGRDITEQKWAEEELRKARDELEQHVEERTRELENANAELRVEVLERKQAQLELAKSEERYRGLFEDSPISLWEEDFSRIKDYIDALRKDGVTDFSRYFDEKPEAVAECMQMVKVCDVNKAALELYEATSKEELFRNLNRVFAAETVPIFRQQLLSISEGRTMLENESVNYTLKGRKMDITLKWIVAPGFEFSFSKVFVAIIDITERKKSESQIQASLKEKEILLKEVNHRVKNNLQVISSLLNLQAKSIKDAVDAAIFKECQNRVKSMVFIHEKLYKSKDFSRIDFSDYVRTLTSSLFHSYGVNAGDLELVISVDDNISLGVDRAIPCGLIINELVSNSLKYAFTPGASGRINIRVTFRDNSYELRVADNGRGFPADVDFRNTTSLGMQLVITLTDQLNGSVELKTAPGSGTEFTIRFGEMR